jgi:hypothetical protein
MRAHIDAGAYRCGRISMRPSYHARAIAGFDMKVRRVGLA